MNRHTLLRVLLVAAIVVAMVATPVAAQEENNSTIDEKAPYYSNETSNVDNESWMDGRENATLDNVMHYATRVATFVIGDGEDASTGPLLAGIFVLGAMLGVTVGSGVGVVGGGVLAIIALAGVAAVGIAPEWFYAVGLFGVGLLIAAALKRAIR